MMAELKPCYEKETYHERCPYCGKEHEQRLWLNIICNCGGKYYFTLKKWWDRRVGDSK